MSFSDWITFFWRSRGPDEGGLTMSPGLPELARLGEVVERVLRKPIVSLTS
jgi:hypothetical protein